MDQINWIQKISSHSEQPRDSVRTSFGCRSICLREIFATPHPPLARSHFSNGRKLTNAGKGFARLFQKSCGYAQTKQLIFVEVFATLFLKKTGKFHYDCSNRCRFRAFSSHREVDTQRSVLSFARSHSTAYMNRFSKGDQAPLRPYSGRS